MQQKAGNSKEPPARERRYSLSRSIDSGSGKGAVYQATPERSQTLETLGLVIAVAQHGLNEVGIRSVNF